MSGVIDLKKHILKKEAAELTPRQVSQKLADQVSATIDSLTMHILDLDRAAGGNQAAPALEAVAHLTELLMVHYVADMKAVFAKHEEKYVCVDRKMWDKAMAKQEEKADAGADAGQDSEGTNRNQE